MKLAPDTAASPDRTSSELTLRGLTKMFLAGIDEYSEDRLGELEIQLCRLIEIVGPEARAELSRSLAPVGRAPARAVRRLAFDEDIAVARPVVSESSALTTADLARIAQTGSPDHVAAVCGRSRLDVAVTDALLDRPDETIAHTVTRNAGAEISVGGFGLLICRAIHDQDLAVSLGTRRDISLAALKSLLFYADETTRAHILANAGPDHRNTVSRILDYLGRNHDPAPHDFTSARAEVCALWSAKALTTNDVHRFAAAKQYEQTAVSVSVLSEAPVQLIDRLFRLTGEKLLLVPCRAADLSWPTMAAVMRLCSMGRPISPDDMDRFRQAYLDMTCTAARSALRHWVVHGPSTGAGTAARRPPVGANRRQATRRVVRINCAVILAEGRQAATCTIVDISATGAKLELAHDAGVPDRFVLLLSTSSGLRRPCKVTWRAGAAIGVLFEGHATATG